MYKPEKDHEGIPTIEVSTNENFFTDNYDHIMTGESILLVDMVYLIKSLK